MDQATDDYALTRVPATARYSWWTMAVQRFGQASSLVLLVIGSNLGYSMSFWDALWAFVFGALIVEGACVAVGIIGTREGLPGSLLSRWTGFGRGGSAVIGLIIGISLTGWFGLQSAIGAHGIAVLVPQVPEWAWALVLGLGVTLISLYGIGSMAWTAYITVPLFLLMVGWSMVTELSRHDLASLVTGPVPGPAMSVLQGTSIVAGGGVLAAVAVADMTRYNRSAGDVVKQTVVGLTAGQLLTGMSGVLLAHAVGTADVTVIALSSVGWVGVLIVVAGTIKINDWNLYSAGLAVVNFISALFGRQVSRRMVTAGIGVLGSVLAAAGAFSSVAGFLIILGFVLPPFCGITVAEYFVVRRWRSDLETSRARGGLPDQAPEWVPATLVVWVVSTVGSIFIPVGFASINAILIAFVLYVVVGKMGLVRPWGIRRTVESDPLPQLLPEG
jgi:cytosine permease